MSRRLIVFALTAMLAVLAKAQYVITFDDNTRVCVEGEISFEGEGLDGTVIRTEAGSFGLAHVTSIEGAGVHGPVVLAYHTSYSNMLPIPEIVTHINYGFAEVYVRNNVYETFKLRDDESNFARLLELKKQRPEVKILLSFTHTIGNADNHQDGGFSCIAASEEYRKAFANDCLAFLQQWGIDGIDLDWEFPGLSWSGAACDPANDVKNYTLLLKQLRETLGDAYLLTYAGFCKDKARNSGGWQYIDVKASEPYVDFVNVMCYDMDAKPNFQNAIQSTRSGWDIERMLKSYKAARFPTSKMVLGIPFYMRHTWGKAFWWSKLPEMAEDPDYIIDNWDEAARVPYVTCKGEFWGSYDNPRSIAAKAEYARANGLLGLFYWCTYQDDADYTLSHAVWDAVQANW